KRLDQALLFAIVADRGAGRVHAAAERRFRDNATVPDGGEHVVPAHHAVPRLDEKLEQVEDLRLDSHELVAAAQFAPLDIHHEIVEMIEQTAPTAGASVQASA